MNQRCVFCQSPLAPGERQCQECGRWQPSRTPRYQPPDDPLDNTWEDENPDWSVPGDPTQARVFQRGALPPPAPFSLGADRRTGAQRSGRRTAPAPTPVRPGRAGSRRGSGHRRFILLAAVALVALALAGGLAAYALLGLTTATVTITPAKKPVSDTFTLSAVTGTPDAAKQQVQARMLSVTTPAETKTVQATGQENMAGRHARGTVNVASNDPSGLTLTAGETFPNESSLCPSLSIVLDANASVPPFNGNTQSVNIPSHYLQIGSIGNTNCFLYESTQQCPIVAGTAPCYRVSLYDTFSGGQDAYNGPVVQQSDIDGAVKSIAQPDPMQVLQPQIKPNERLVGTPHCTPQVTSDHQAGDKGAQVNVSVTFTCAGEVYDHGAAVAMVSTLLRQQAATDPGAGYALVGQLTTTITAGAADAQNTVALTVSAQGVWAYQVSDALQQVLAHRIAGMSVYKAQQVLSTQPGVAQAAIDISGGGQTLPSDPSNIKIVVQGV